MRRPLSEARWKREASVRTEPLDFHITWARLEGARHGSSAELPGFTVTLWKSFRARGDTVKTEGRHYICLSDRFRITTPRR